MVLPIGSARGPKRVQRRAKMRVVSTHSADPSAKNKSEVNVGNKTGNSASRRAARKRAAASGRSGLKVCAMCRRNEKEQCTCKTP